MLDDADMAAMADEDFPSGASSDTVLYLMYAGMNHIESCARKLSRGGMACTCESARRRNRKKRAKRKAKRNG